MNQISKVIVAAFLLSMIVTFVISSFNPASFSSALVLQTTKTPIPEPYYTTPRNPDLVSADLVDLLINHTTMPHEYERDVFDCTEGAAYLEWYLENHGYDTDIVHGVRTPWGFHAIVVVHLKDRDEGIIDAFTPSFYYGPPPKDGHVLKDIYEVWRWEGEQWEDISGWKREYSEYDWWNEVSLNLSHTSIYTPLI